MDRLPDGCWIWTGGVTDRGTPRFTADGQSSKSVRIWLHEQRVGPVPADKISAPPSCGRSLCVAPEHERFQTRSEAQKGRLPSPGSTAARNAAKDACDSGHPFDEENTRFDHRKGDVVTRACRKCEADRKKAARVAARASGRPLR